MTEICETFRIHQLPVTEICDTLRIHQVTVTKICDTYAIRILLVISDSKHKINICDYSIKTTVRC